MPRVTTDVPPQAAALQGIGHQKSTSRNHTRQGDLPKKHGDAFIAVVEGFTMEPPGARLAVSPPPFKVNFLNSRFRLFIVNGNTDRGTWEDWNSLSSVIHVFAESWIWHSYLSMLQIAQWTQQHSPGLEGPNKRHWSLSSPTAVFSGFRCFLSAQFLSIVQPEDQFETHRLQEGILAKREI